MVVRCTGLIPGQQRLVVLPGVNVDRNRPRDGYLPHVVQAGVQQLPDSLVTVQMAQLGEHVPTEPQRMPQAVVIATYSHRRARVLDEPSHGPSTNPGLVP